MPVAIDPNARVRFVLESDKGKSPEPAFFVRPLTMRVWRKLADTTDEMLKATEGNVAANKLIEAIKIGLVGWEGIVDAKGNDIPFDPDKLEDIIDVDEAKELLDAVQDAGRLAREDKKKSESPPSSSMENSAKSAGQDSALTAPVSSSP